MVLVDLLYTLEQNKIALHDHTTVKNIHQNKTTLFLFIIFIVAVKAMYKRNLNFFSIFPDVMSSLYILAALPCLFYIYDRQYLRFIVTCMGHINLKALLIMYKSNE